MLIKTAMLLLFSSSIILAKETKMDLSPYKWKNRVIVVQGSESNTSFQKAHIKLRTTNQELVERDVIILNESGDKFEIQLFGKDGEKKWVGSKDFDVSEILKLIDSMPMRKSEIRDRI